MSWNLSAVVVAAGESQRFRESATDSRAIRSKVLVEKEAKPLFLHTLEALLPLEPKEFILVVKEDLLSEFMDSMLAWKHPEIPVRFALGGARRQDSVCNGVLTIDSASHVAIHDAARPFLSKDFLMRLRAEALKSEAVIPVQSISETVKELDESGFVKATHNRDRLFRVQTPQIFSYSKIKEAHLKFQTSEKIFTDDAMMFEELGWPVKTCAGETSNLKVTTVEDLVSGEWGLKAHA